MSNLKPLPLFFIFLLLPQWVLPMLVPQVFEGKVTGVKDGDTIEVLYEGEALVIRLVDIDCPEKKQAYGQAAKTFTSNFCFGKTVKVVSKGKKDRYDRILATILVADQNLNEALVKAGLAWHFKKYSNSASYAELENQARQNKVGLWADEHPVAPWEWRD